MPEIAKSPTEAASATEPSGAVQSVPVPEEIASDGWPASIEGDFTVVGIRDRKTNSLRILSLDGKNKGSLPVDTQLSEAQSVSAEAAAQFQRDLGIYNFKDREAADGFTEGAGHPNNESLPWQSGPPNPTAKNTTVPESEARNPSKYSAQEEASKQDTATE